MKKYTVFFFLVSVISIGAIPAFGQCDPSVESPIKCSYYNEGYQDGMNDARSYRSNDYRRYRDKYENKYESYFRNGYQAGYNSITPSFRWTNSQRSAYDSGYTIGQNDRRNGGETRSSNTGSGYDSTIGRYFQQGYSDGFNGRSRRYDFDIGGGDPGPIWPPPGGNNGNATATWSGRVDGRANIIIRGNVMRTEDASGGGVQVRNETMYGTLPRRSTTVTARKRDGRGNVTVIQQPSNFNDYVAIIQVDDPRGGAGDYRVDISWESSRPNREEPYQSGSVYWRGRVDQTVNIVINGSDVQSQDVAATGMSNVRFDINGYLAHRPGIVTASRRKGRGTVTIIQQPSWENDFTAVVQISDVSGGADNYEVEIRW